VAEPSKCLSWRCSQPIANFKYLFELCHARWLKGKRGCKLHTLRGDSGILNCRRAQMLTVPKLPERKSLQQLLMSVQSCLTCYELAAAEVRARAGATATIITLAWGIKNTYSLWPMPFPLHSKLLLQLLFVLPWRVLLLLQGKSCAFSWLSMYMFLFSEQNPPN